MDKLKWLFIIVLLGALLTIPQLSTDTLTRIFSAEFVSSVEDLLPTNKTLTILIQIFIIAGLAASWNILGGYAGQINLGHAAFFGLGFLTTRLLWLDDYPFVLSFIAGGVVATIFALIIGAPALRLRGIYFAIGTLALAQALNITIGNILPGNSALPGPKIVSYELAPRYYVALGVLTVIVIVSYWLTRAKLGLGMMTIREDEEAAQSIGVNAFHHKISAFVMSAFFAGLIGSTWAYFHVSYYYQSAFIPLWTFDAVLIAFIGGIGTIAGPLVGAVFFVVVRDELATNWPNFHLIIFGILFILVVLILPGGLMELWDRVINIGKALKPQPAIEPTAEVKGEEGTM